jgi:hypothetical protein
MPTSLQILRITCIICNKNVILITEIPKISFILKKWVGVGTYSCK